MGTEVGWREPAFVEKVAISKVTFTTYCTTFEFFDNF